MKAALLPLLVLPFTGFVSIPMTAQPVLQKPWHSTWISIAGENLTQYGVYEFLKQISLDSVPDHFRVNVSADNRYKLFVNGEQVSLGPSLGDLEHWYYHTVDLAPQLKPGSNEILALVWNDGPQRAVHQFSAQTAFMLRGEDKGTEQVNSNASWQCRRLNAYHPLQQHVLGYYAADPGEFVDYRLQPSEWSQAIGLSAAMPSGSQNVLSSSWALLPTAIPELALQPQRIAATRRVSSDSLTHVSLPKGFPASTGSLTVPAHSSVSILMDQKSLTNAFMHLSFEGGRDASLVMRYAEGLYDQHEHKGNRDDIEGKHFMGRCDSLIADGQPQAWTSLQWRTFRYLQLDIRTQEQPLQLRDLSCTAAGYPLDKQSTATCSDPVVEKILEVGWRTASRCAMETYFDCPYYEQLQYVGDTRIQAMITYINANDDRLGRKAITLIDGSRRSDGLTQSRYPSSLNHLIPPFSFAWIGMVYDFYRYRPDAAFVRQQLNGVRQVLHFFSQYQQADGRLQSVPYWQFTDWAEEAGRSWRHGAAVLDKQGYSAVLDQQWLQALQMAGCMETSLGDSVQGQRDLALADQLKASIRSHYLNGSTGLLADNGDKKNYSQQANSLAILTGVFTPEEAAAVAQKMVDPEQKMTKASIYFQYYLHQALAKGGLADGYLTRLDVWRQNLELGMTTWGEDSKVASTRSDCHAWGASPNIEYYRTVLGIDSDAPGFAKVRIEPHLGTLTQASGSMPHPLGNISASYQLLKNGKGVRATITLPLGLCGILVWKGQKYALHPGINNFENLNF